MVLEVGNFYYYFLFFLMIFISLVTGLIIKNRSKTFNKVFIFCLLLSGFILHFAKLLIEPYVSKFPYSIANSTFENICAASTILFPWFYLSKSKLLKDYMVVIGMFSIISAFLLPSGMNGQKILQLDVIRYYYAHLIIFMAPYLMAFTNIHQISYKRIVKVPMLFLGILMLIYINEVILMCIGLYNGDFSTLLNPNMRNTSLIKGPSEAIQRIGFIDFLVPNLFKTIPYGINAGQKTYWPILWMIVPAHLVIISFGFIQCFVFNNVNKLLRYSKS